MNFTNQTKTLPERLRVKLVAVRDDLYHWQHLTWLAERTKSMFPTLRNNAAAGNRGPVKIKLLKGADLGTVS